MSQNVHEEFVNKNLWEMFRKRFKSHTTEASYWSDIMEFCRFCGKRAEDTEKGDADRYYAYMKERAESGKISPLTVTKKFPQYSYLCDKLPKGAKRWSYWVFL